MDQDDINLGCSIRTMKVYIIQNFVKRLSFPARLHNLLYSQKFSVRAKVLFSRVNIQPIVHIIGALQD